ncbi:MAG: DUF6553 family protein [Saccharofermentanales bacterium]|nr:hypothetical protein [Clostridiaceae bacterium]
MNIDPNTRFEQDRQLMADPTAPAEERRKAGIRQAFWQSRYRPVRHSKVPADLFLGVWTNLLLNVTGSNWRLPLKRIRRDLDVFFNRPVLLDAMRDAGDQAAEYLQVELDDSARLYFLTCKQDSRYSALLFGLIKLKPEQIANKSATETIDGFIRPLLYLIDHAWCAPMITAVCQAYRTVFPEYAASFNERLLQLDAAFEGRLRNLCDQILE